MGSERFSEYQDQWEHWEKEGRRPGGRTKGEGKGGGLGGGKEEQRGPEQFRGLV